MKLYESLFDGYLIANTLKAIRGVFNLHKHLKYSLILQNPTLGLFDRHVINDDLLNQFIFP